MKYYKIFIGNEYDDSNYVLGSAIYTNKTGLRKFINCLRPGLFGKDKVRVIPLFLHRTKNPSSYLVIRQSLFKDSIRIEYEEVFGEFDSQKSE